MPPLGLRPDSARSCGRALACRKMVAHGQRRPVGTQGGHRLNLVQGFITAGTPVNLLWALVSCTVGTAVGVLPGIGPFVAGTSCTKCVILMAPRVAEHAIRLRPPEYFLLMVLAFCTVSAVLCQSTVRDMTALGVG